MIVLNYFLMYRLSCNFGWVNNNKWSTKYFDSYDNYNFDFHDRLGTRWIFPSINPPKISNSSKCYWDKYLKFEKIKSPILSYGMNIYFFFIIIITDLMIFTIFYDFYDYFFFYDFYEFLHFFFFFTIFSNKNEQQIVNNMIT